MTLLVLGLLLWIGAHTFPRLAPSASSGVTASLGAGPSKGLSAGIIGLGLVLMVVGYSSAPFTAIYDPPAWTIHLNNLMMLAAVGLFGMGRSKGRARAWLRHPMLTGVVVWAVAHLLVNGDLASLVLFGGLGVWAIGSMVLINATAGPWQHPEPGPLSGDIRLVVIAVVLFAVIAAIHSWLGYWPFPQ
jgi:uncharacterized membrane protein